MPIVEQSGGEWNMYNEILNIVCSLSDAFFKKSESEKFRFWWE